MNQHVAVSEPRTNVEAVCQTIARPEFRQRLAAALPPGVDPDRFQRVILTAIQQNPKLADGDRQSLYMSSLRAAADGLVPDGREGAFVEMGGKITWMPMVGGIIKRLAGAGINIDAQVVYENDEFEQTLGDDAAIHHKAPKLGTPRGKPLGSYAIARLPNGMIMREVMDTEQIEQVRSVSRAKGGDLWTKWWTEAARKTVIRRLAKRLPILDPAIAETIQRDDELYDFAAGNAGPADTQPETVATQPAGPRRPRGLDKVAAAVGGPQAPAGDVLEGTSERVDQSTGEVLPAEDAGDGPSPGPDDTRDPDF